MKPVTIIYVTDMDASLDFYRTLLPHGALVTQSPYWSELGFGSASIALHVASKVEPGTQLGLALTADAPLEQIRQRLADAGIVVSQTIEDQPFGRSMRIEDLDGLAIQINEHSN